MISIDRAPAPPELADSRAIDAYSKKAVVNTLWLMQNKKCCYCERPIPGEGHAKAVEHFAPKDIFEDLRNEWVNLLMACSQCNGKKSNKYPVLLLDEAGVPKIILLTDRGEDAPLLINPSDPDIDPELHIDFDIDDTHDNFFAVPFSKDGCNMDEPTITILGLDSEELYKDRRRYYNGVLRGAYTNLLTAHNNLIPDNRASELALQTQVNHMNLLLSSENEYAAFARSIARYQKLDERFGVVIPGPHN